eukprot:Protomagalhaensia_sp_Gyna_25__253@NODE_111_length_5195_cov_31_637704_g88_i0_p1_GENE_NODE_111_length_5195_cov_31_637704_g88_i0NODE_111_length_5195_cov_31_637704_g88_i0_p1_ORF_typecomplete_len549_score78_29TPR_16/PF13432_6/0_0057TPR_16/PF13432_6/2_4e09TPR_16/PF13432_6/3_3e11TPR_16/PF13432_6/0_0083TPR_16/PF13432_6/0_0026TPR_16/PF13432_6/8_5e06TPR_16/PF13432_6/7_4e06TPR_16/PF13432_6/29TPR_16/PF13432_6/8e08TPR_16/PF13432_6/4_9e07TPR_16/PF13432_6/7_8e08TPR_19/PF14559_6/0_0062TPR_19/PF14559_6/2e07TPR_1
MKQARHLSLELRSPLSSAERSSTTRKIKERLEHLREKPKVTCSVAEVAARLPSSPIHRYRRRGGQSSSLEMYGQEADPVARKHMDEGMRFIKSRDFNQAVKAFDEAIRISPGNTEAYCRRSGVCRCLHDYRAALRDAVRATELDPTSAAAWNCKGLCLFELRQYAEARAALTEAIHWNSNNALYYYNRSNALLKLSLIRLALSDADRAVELNDRHGAAWNNKGLCHFRLGEHGEAVKALNEAIKDEPDNAAYFANRCSARLAASDYIDALQDAERVIDLQRHDPGGYDLKGHCLLGLGNCREAQRSWDQAIKRSPLQADLFMSRSQALTRVGDRTAALKDARKAAQLAPDCAETWNWQGQCQMVAKDSLSAKVSFDQAIELEPQESSYYVSRSEAHLELNEMILALRDARRAVKLSPQSAAAWSQRGRCLAQMHKFHDAKEAYDKAIEAAPDSAKLYCHRGLVFTELHNLGAALEDANRAVERDPGNADFWNLKGFCHFSLNEHVRASMAYLTGLRIDPNHSKCQSGLAATLSTGKSSPISAVFKPSL